MKELEKELCLVRISGRNGDASLFAGACERRLICGIGVTKYY
jgi:hypothetical protein